MPLQSCSKKIQLTRKKADNAYNALLEFIHRRVIVARYISERSVIQRAFRISLLISLCCARLVIQWHRVVTILTSARVKSQ